MGVCGSGISMYLEIDLFSSVCELVPIYTIHAKLVHKREETNGGGRGVERKEESRCHVATIHTEDIVIKSVQCIIPLNKPLTTPIE